ncbi:MAG TPA: nucleotide exchange factor GrpE [Candidatus Avirikenella pullistercoris]|nr:nucleotide exchange factor GrpE [Candidatus Avirikenella pullistercoris]
MAADEGIDDEEGTLESEEKQEKADNVAEEPEEKDDNKAVLAEQVKEWQDKYLRLSAEFDNYRKRTLKEKMELIDTAGSEVIKSILAVIDDFDRAMAAMETATDVAAVREGVQLIHQKLMDTLKQKGLSEIEAMGKELDTDFHDAIAKVPVEEKEKKGKVIDVVQKGYQLKDKVIRFSKVVVGE